MIRKKIKVHHPISNQTRYIRYFHFFCDALITELKKTYDVEEHRYTTDASISPIHIKLQGGSVDNFYMDDSDIIIENEKNQFVIFTATDIITPPLLLEKNNPNLKKVFISQYYSENVKANVKDDNIYIEKYSPWIYFPHSTINLEPFFHKRKYITNFIDKMVFRGVTAHRQIVNYFSKDIMDGPEFLNSELEYYEDIIKYKVGLSTGGRGEFCYRDIEYMAIGIPFLRFTYQSKMLPGLIPNFHYISVDVPDDLPVDPHRDNMPHDSRGTEQHAELLSKRFLEVKDDRDFLEFISRNARIYYETYLAPVQNVKYTISLINDFLIA